MRLLLALALASACYGQFFPFPGVRPTTPTGSVLWSADMETGDNTQWYAPSTGPTGDYGGSPENSGVASDTASTTFAHAGTYSLKLQISTPNSPTSGVRMFRWKESRENRGAYYSVWMYIPTLYTLTGDPATGHYVNLFQFKSSSEDHSLNTPVWGFYIDDSHAGQWYIKAGWGAGGTTLAGPHAGDPVSIKSYTQTIAALPIGQWVHIEAYMYQANDYTGHLTLWQDGVQLFDFSNVITGYSSCNYNAWCTDIGWSVNLYSDGLTPDPAVIYIDDASIRSAS